ncbi:hypothetical protein ACFP2T_46770 [Plantactinospora solaniradicis]|uniref:Uncharacterized protein n=1 Tax=Plantactinospora solaniradicis TaxID=1723736 RepID=A0ABW1KQF5_9ACTN
MRWPFACRSRLFSSGNLGSHDGIGFWTLHTARLGSHDRQHRVSVHERLHHDLIMSTPWGLLTSVLGALTEVAEPSIEHEDMFLRAAAWSTDVHEMYATYFSIGLDRTVLDADDLGDAYRAYYDAADQFCPDRDTAWPARAIFTHAALIAAMAPVALSDLLARPLATWCSEDLYRLEPHHPDARWRHIVLHKNSAWMEFRRRGLGDVPPVDREHLIYTHKEMAEALLAAGVVTMDRDDYRQLIGQLLPQLNSYLGTRPHYEIVDQPVEPSRAELEEHQRERLQFRDRPRRKAPAGDTLVRHWTAFAATHPGLGVHTVLYWLRADLLERQVAGQSYASSHVLAIMPGVEPDPASDDLLLWTMNGDLGPDPVARIFTAHDQRLIVATTLATIADAPDHATSTLVPQLYTLIDIPMLPVLESWAAAGAAVRWHSSWIDGPYPLYAFAFDVSVNPGLVLLHLTSSAGRTLLLHWLATNAPAAFVRDRDWGAEESAPISSLVQHLTAGWWFLDQRAGYRKSPGTGLEY